MRELYVVFRLAEERSVNIGTMPKTTVKLKLAWADGMIGAMPAFDNKEDAIKYADGAEIFEAALLGGSNWRD